MSDAQAAPEDGQTSTTTDPGKAIHLLRPDSTHTHLIPNPAALATLEGIKGPVTVLTLVGPQRGGKSTLLNLLHSRNLASSGFGLGHHMDPQASHAASLPRH